MSQPLSVPLQLQTPPLLLLLLLLLLLHWPLPSDQLRTCGHCFCDRPTLSCDFDGSKDKIVENIDLGDFMPSASKLHSLDIDPTSYSDLYVNCKMARVLKSQRLTRDLLRAFTNLTRLSVVKWDLVAIDADALVDLVRLRELDVSENQLGQLPPGLFASKSLTVVRLSENHGLTLGSGSFQGARFERLVLSKCGLDQFPLASLEQIASLQELTLSQNSIRVVPEAAKRFVDQLRVFYLDENPLSCTCPNKWLREVNWTRVSPSLTKSLNEQMPKCASPSHMASTELTALSAADFPCAPPHLTSVELQLGPSTGRLACSARSPDQPPSGRPLVWTYRQFPIYADSAYLAGGYNMGGRTYQGTGDTFVQSFERSSRHQRERYLVSASTEDGREANFTLTVHWPPAAGQQQQQQMQPPILTQLPPPPSLRELQPQPQPPPPLTPARPGDAASDENYFSRRQFTLVEMIVAVIGTFMATALVFLLVCQFTRWYSRRDRKRWATYTAHPYSAAGGGFIAGGSGGYGYQTGQQLQQHRPPSHEYDVPRMELTHQQHQQHQQTLQSPCLLSKQLSTATSVATAGGVCATEFEFLDYTGGGGGIGSHHRMLYNRV